jgi:multiple sugar transport system permease protein
MTTAAPLLSVPVRRRLGKTAYYLVCGLFAFIFLFPLFWSLLNAVKPASEAAASPPTFLPSRITLENFVKLNQYGAGIGRYLFNSVSVSLITVLCTVVISTLGGYGFSRFRFRGKNLLFVIILSTLMIPFQSILIPLFMVLIKLKLNDTLLGLALVYITFQLPFGIFIMRSAFDAVPREIEESALLDGCNSFNLLYKVMLSLVKPGIVTVSIYTFINAWNEFMAALIFMSKEENFTLPILLNAVRSQRFNVIDWGALQAGMVFAILPCVILFLLLQRYYIEGLTAGAVKG